METAGVKSGNHIQVLQNRVRDAFRRRLRWRLERDRESVGSHSYRDDREPAAKRWTRFSPIAIQRFRSLFSSGESSNASLEGRAETCSKNVMDDMTPTNTNQESPSGRYHNTDPEMVNTKTEEKKGVEKEKVIGSGDGKAQQFEVSPTLPAEEILSKVNTHIPMPDHIASTSSTNLAKASDDSNIIPPCNESESCMLSNVQVSTAEKSSQGNDENSLSCSKDTKSSHDTNEAIHCEEDKATSLKPLVRDSDSIGQNLAVVPSIAFDEINAEVLPVKNETNTRKQLEPLHLNLESSKTSPSLMRKSPVTVQEWVDSIPLTSQIDEDPEPETSPTSEEDHGDACPSVTVQPACGAVAERRREAFSRDASPSLQSDTGSHGSSVDSYLEARKPDPEEVLLGLGFGGSVHAAEAEVSRIPARFLQPSKVKGVEIDDFLRYQQDLIETFESGYSGYRGLIGGSQIPSVIVAKIMEKLREHERESSVKSSAGSSPGPGHHVDLTRRRFSRAAQRVSILTKMKSRDSIASGGPQAHSVLNPDNRKFLDNQGSKSPEVSRKRMIIGHRSFTFDGDGQLIETEIGEEGSSVPHNVAAPKPPPSARPLIHNDSVVSSATSQSFTSYDSDSDLEETSGYHRNSSRSNHLLQRLYSIPAVTSYCSSGAQRELSKNQIDQLCEEIASNLSKRRKSLPSSIDTALKESMKRDNTSAFHGDHAEEKHVNFSTTPLLSSTPLKEGTFQDSEELSLPSKCTLSVPISPKSHNEQVIIPGNVSCQNGPKTLRSVEETERTPLDTGAHFTGNGLHYANDLEMASFNQIMDFSLPEDHNPQKYAESSDSFASDSQYERHVLQMNPIPKSSAMYLDRKTRRQLSLTFSSDSYNASTPSRSQVSKNWSTSSASSWECEANTSPNSASYLQEVSPMIGYKGESGSPVLPSSSRSSRRGSLKRQQNIDEDDFSVRDTAQSCVSSNVDHLKALNENEKGDSFEMEELGIEEEVVVIRTGSAHSDSSGFQEGLCLIAKQLSESAPLLSVENLPDTQTVEHLKRLSLPVIRIQDESGILQWRTSSFHHDIPSRPRSCINSLRRSRSLPSHLFYLGDSMSPGSISDSIGNMFSSCSDDSVIHLPRSCGNTGAESEQAASFPLLVAISDRACEEGTCCETRQCNNHNCVLKKSLVELHNSMPYSADCKEILTCMNRDLQSLQDAQLKMKSVVQHMQGYMCTLPDCNMKAVLEKVSDVAEYQSDLCAQLEKITSDAQKIAGIFPSNSCDLSNSCQKPCSVVSGKLTEVESCQLHHSDTVCRSLCKVILEENHRLQDVVKQNVQELAQIRKLLQALLINVKE